MIFHQSEKILIFCRYIHIDEFIIDAEKKGDYNEKDHGIY